MSRGKIFAAVLMLTPAVASAQLFTDTFETNTSGLYTVNAETDTAIFFNYDYGLDGIPSAPNSAPGTTRGLKMTANMEAPNAAAAITATPTGIVLSAQDAAVGYRVRFDMWINANGPFPAGGVGSTEHLVSGVGYDGSTVIRSGVSGSGTWFQTTGEGGAGTGTAPARDYVAGIGSANLNAETNSGLYAAGNVSTSQDHGDPYYNVFGGHDVAAINGGQLTAAQGANQTGNLLVGAVGMAWREVELLVEGSTVIWMIDGRTIATVTDAPTTGQVAIGYADLFTSVSGNPNQSFGLIDNLVVEVIPEPTSLSLLVVAGLLALRRRRLT